MSTLVFGIACINFFLTVFSLFKIPRQYFLKNYFIAFTFTTFLWLLANFIQIRIESYLWLRTAYALGALMIASAMVMMTAFIRQRRVSLFPMAAWYILGFIFFFLNYVPNVFFREKLLIPENFRNLKAVYSPFFSVYSLYLFGSVIHFTFNMWQYARQSSGIKKKQALAFLYGMAILGAWSLFFSFLLPLFGVTHLINLDVCGSLFFVGFVSYAIYRYQIMGISLIIRRSTLYGILIALITGIYLASILIFESLFQNILRYHTLVTRLMAAVVIAFTFLPLRNRIEHFVNRSFFHTPYNYSQTLINFSEKLVTILELRELLGTIVENISQILQVDHAALLIREKKGNDYRIKSSVGFENEIRELFFPAEDPLITWLLGRLHRHDQIAIRSALGEEESDRRETLISRMDILKAELCIPLFFQDQLIGVLAIGEKKNRERYISDDLRLLRTLANHAATALANSFIYDDLKKNYLGTIEALAKAIEAKDIYVRGHSERVVKIATEIAKEMNLSREDINILRYAGILHDIGKIAVSDEILKKNALLDNKEQQLMKKHPETGENIIASIDFLQDVRLIIRHHHERWDGNGYPNGLSHQQIPLLSRVLCIADAFDAMTSARSYRPPLPNDAAMQELRQNAGTQFDPEIIDFFFRACQRTVFE